MITSSPGPTPARRMQRCRPAVPLDTAAQWRAPTASASSPSKRAPVGPEREPAGAQHLEHELLVALVDPGRRERDVPRCLRHACARAKFATGSRHCAQRSLSPLAVSRYAFWIASVISPTPMT